MSTFMIEIGTYCINKLQSIRANFLITVLTKHERHFSLTLLINQCYFYHESKPYFNKNYTSIKHWLLEALIYVQQLKEECISNARLALLSQYACSPMLPLTGWLTD